MAIFLNSWEVPPRIRTVKYFEFFFAVVVRMHVGTCGTSITETTWRYTNTPGGWSMPWGSTLPTRSTWWPLVMTTPLRSGGQGRRLGSWGLTLTVVWCPPWRLTNVWTKLGNVRLVQLPKELDAAWDNWLWSGLMTIKWG